MLYGYYEQATPSQKYSPNIGVYARVRKLESCRRMRVTGFN